MHDDRSTSIARPDSTKFRLRLLVLVLLRTAVSCDSTVMARQQLTIFLSRIVNIAIGALMIFGGISQFFGDTNFGLIIVGVYTIIFGLSMSSAPSALPPLLS
jgi:hypothetical protein